MTVDKIEESCNVDPEIDYKNLERLKSCILEGGRIIPGRIAGNTPWEQRQAARSVKIARYLALLPYTDQH